MEHSTEILYNKTEVSCSAVHRFGSDALLLARFCEPRRSQKAADLCSGCGIVSLEWHDRGHRGPCAAVELQPEASALLQEAVAAQGIGHITPYLADLRTFREGEGQFDVCACNPPYFTAGPQSTDAGRATARHETDCTLEDVCACGFRLLKDGGKLSLCHRPERLAEVLAVLPAHRTGYAHHRRGGDVRRSKITTSGRSIMAGILYIVATPIGNLDDMPPRVAATFGAADFVAAEDTRVTMRLLNYLGLKKPMVSYYEHALQKGEGILRRIEAGENCALCSDAGMPCVSDPGEVIVRDALARGIKVVPVPAASACVTALAVSGQDTSRWVFEGFLPVNRKQKKERLAELLGEKRTVIFYEAPHKLRTTLDDLVNAFGPERSITLCRELTKLHEEIWKTTLGEAQAHYAANEPRGEYVLVMAGAPASTEPEAEMTLEQAAQRALELTGQGFGPTAAAKAAAQGTPYSKSEVYKALLTIQQREPE